MGFGGLHWVSPDFVEVNLRLTGFNWVFHLFNGLYWLFIEV